MSVAPSRASDDPGLRRLGWTVLASLFGVALVAALVQARPDWDRPAFGESTALMAAESLIHDRDLRYERRDHDRFVLGRGEPPDLELASASGRTIGFDLPAAYPLWLAPWLLISAQGFALANLVALGFAVFFVARTLEREVGSAAALYLAVLIFASAVVVYLFLAGPEIFLLALTAGAFALVAGAHRPSGELAEIYGGESLGEPEVRRRFVAAGALLAVPVASELLLLILPLGAWLAAPRDRRGTARKALLLGLGLGLAAIVIVQWWTTGGLLWGGVDRFRFGPETGFPAVDFTTSEWPEAVRRLSAFHWEGAPRFTWGLDPALWLWNLRDVLLGRHLGLLPYFAPLLLLFLAGRRNGYRRGLWVAAALWIPLLLLLRPFSFQAGPGPLGLKAFLPVYGMLWLTLGDRPASRARRFGEVTLAVAGAGLFLFPVWMAPGAMPVDPEGAPTRLAPLASHLPFEISQRWLRDAHLVEADGVWLKTLDDRAWPEAHRRRLVFEGPEPAAVLVASPYAIRSFRWVFGPDAPSQLEVGGAEVTDRLLSPGGGIEFRVVPEGRPRRHAMWWTPQRQWLYLVEMGFPSREARAEPLGFRLELDGVIDQESSR